MRQQRGIVIGASWHVAKALPGAVEQAERRLADRGFETFLPFDVERIVERGVAAETRRPLFGPYLFVAFDPDGSDQRWRSINSTRGVKHLLPMHAERPCRLPRGVVEEMKARSGAGEFVSEVIDVLLGFAPGDVVAIVAGTYAGHVGRFREQRGRAIDLMMRILGAQDVKVTVPVDVVQRPGRVRACQS